MALEACRFCGGQVLTWPALGPGRLAETEKQCLQCSRPPQPLAAWAEALPAAVRAGLDALRAEPAPALAG